MFVPIGVAPAFSLPLVKSARAYSLTVIPTMIPSVEGTVTIAEFCTISASLTR